MQPMSAKLMTQPVGQVSLCPAYTATLQRRGLPSSSRLSQSGRVGITRCESDVDHWSLQFGGEVPRHEEQILPSFAACFQGARLSNLINRYEGGKDRFGNSQGNDILQAVKSVLFNLISSHAKCQCCTVPEYKIVYTSKSDTMREALAS